MAMLGALAAGIPVDPLPFPQRRNPSLPHAPDRRHNLNSQQRKLALQNALRYFPERTHKELAPEFAKELQNYGHIYMYRFMPTFPLKAYPLDAYPARSRQAACIMLMICNNLDPAVAQFPQELVTYGGNGQVFSNWAQFWLTMRYLSEMTEEQTLVMYSGHPVGLFPSDPGSPRAVITNGMVVPNYSSKETYDDLFALGVTMYGQMTAGSYCYIGPQGIVHGTTITLLNAGRKYLGIEDMAGKVFVTSGLGGMSGAQAKAAVIAGCIGVVAEVNIDALNKRKSQGWVMEVESDLDKLINRIKLARKNKEVVSIGFHGNIVSLWERLACEEERLVDLGSDQTSCHDIQGGGYCPVQVDYDSAMAVMNRDPSRFQTMVRETLVRHAAAINRLAARGMFFWDYGNAFLLEARRAGADVCSPGDLSGIRFRYPSYVQDIMGDIFSLGFGPFRWVCTSGQASDLDETDRIAEEEMEKVLSEGVENVVAAQYRDNLRWIRAAQQHQMVVGSQARILYSDRAGRIRIALAFNKAVGDGRLNSRVVVSRDHHDVSGTDSPFRETSNIEDGSAFTADMAVQNCIGDSFRGATWVSLHNGGGVGWGEAMNGGFGLVLDGSPEAGRRAALMLGWDVANGIVRRCWSGNTLARSATEAAMSSDPLLRVTTPYHADDALLSGTLESIV